MKMPVCNLCKALQEYLEAYCPQDRERSSSGRAHQV